MHYILVFLLSFIGMLTQEAAATSYGYACDVAWCNFCSFTNFCGVCQTNYILMINPKTSVPYCAPVTCSSNCSQCYSNNTCETCNYGYKINSTGQCSNNTISISCSSASCLSCSVSSTNCTSCAYGYNLQNGRCLPNNGMLIKNCKSGFTGYRCQLCQSGYYVNPSFGCTVNPYLKCDVPNCDTCTTNNTCSSCNYRFVLSSGSQNICEVRKCNIHHCVSCTNLTGCSECQAGYTLDINSLYCVPKYFGCNVTNCQYCSTTNICGRCKPGYLPKSLQNTDKNGALKIVGSQCELATYAKHPFLPRHCKSYGYVYFAGYIYSGGCQSCLDGFVQVGHKCVANLSIQNYICNVANCLYCVQNNVCGKCETGYTEVPGDQGVCMKMYSALPNCLQSMPDLFSVPVCSICETGYALTSPQGGNCKRIWPSAMCNLRGCQYCLSSNTCQSCSDGYTLKNGTCAPQCNVTNCYQCSDSTNCAVCDSQYNFNNSKYTECVNKTKINVTCSSKFGSKCNQCNYTMCTNCTTGTAYDSVSKTCKTAAAHDVYRCARYTSNFSNTCAMCQNGYNLLPGFKLFPNQCLGVYCGIANCAYCYGSTSCVLCNQGYAVQDNGSCAANVLTGSCVNTSYAEYCQTCNTDGTCQTCLKGYKMVNGACVCPFQNCLKCMGSSYCTVCAYPTSIGLFDTPGCGPSFVANMKCNVSNCRQCSMINTCSVCSFGYSLDSNRACVKNTCQNNCDLCTPSKNICFVCAQGYLQQKIFSPNCVKLNTTYKCLVQGCAVCSNSTACSSCLNDFYLTENKTCKLYECTENCLMCFANKTCSICMTGFHLNASNITSCITNNASIISNCSNQIKGCVYCSLSKTSKTQCQICYFGMKPSANASECIPQTCTVPNCSICMPNTENACYFCQQGYTTNTYMQCVPYVSAAIVNQCSIYNCLYCDTQSTCSQCLKGWNTTDGICVTQQYCNVVNCSMCTESSLCYKCNTNYTVSSDKQSCLPVCNISNCSSCKSLSQCNQCNTSFVISSDRSNCSCNKSYVVNSSSGLCACPVDFIAYNFTCYLCNTTTKNCSYCSKNNTCGKCINNLVLNSSNQCNCPGNLTFNVSSKMCVCNNTQFFNNSCITCNVDNCSTCNSNDNCSTCINNLIANSSGKCNCPGNLTFNASSKMCVCNNTQFYNNSCITCNVSNCSTCDSNNNCSKCYTNFTINKTAGNCSCPSPFNYTNNSCLCNGNYTLYDSQCIQCGISKCQTCNKTKICQNCTSNYTVSKDGKNCSCMSTQTDYQGYCYNCDVPNCQTCHSNNYCFKCKSNLTVLLGGVCGCSGQTTLFNNSCIKCQINNCTLCKSNNNCSTCAPMYLNEQNKLCRLCNITNCKKCSSDNVCQVCNNSLQVSPDNTTCLICNITNCSFCSYDNVCAACQQGYSFSTTTQNCLICQANGCNVCASKNKCRNCQIGYELSLTAQNCTTCISPCKTCNANGSCATCLPLYSYYPDTANNNKCFKCKTANCFKCNSTNPSQCLQCKTNYNLNKADSTCSFSCKSFYCLSCNSNGICLKCSRGYTPNGDSCRKCNNAPVCQQCSQEDPAICVTCSSGYYQSNGKCYNCPYSYCETCTSSNCLTFKNSTGIFGYDKNGTLFPAKCDSSCLVCSSKNPLSCSVCRIGFALDTSNPSLTFCVPCASNCKTCYSTNASKCLSCYSNAVFQSSNNTCQACSAASNCLTCSPTNISQCVTCPLYSSLTSTKICKKGCPLNCLSCSSSSFCTQCVSGFAANSQGYCITCPSFCRQCSGDAPNVCLGCGDGLYLNSGGSCSACSSNCLSCTDSSCLTCRTGFSLTSDFTCQPKCSIPCASCLSGKPSQCTTCLAGYSYKQSTHSCTPITQCSGSCTLCPFQYVLNGGKCVKCTSSNCQRCTSSNLGQCISCNDGYYLNTTSHSCSACPNNCATCSSSTNCLTCSAGSTALAQSIPSIVQCVACKFPCVTCQGNPETCLSCASKYSLDGWTCLSQLNIGISLTLSIQMSTFYGKYRSFLLAIAKYFGSSNPGAVTVLKISSGSVLFDGKVSLNPNENSETYQSYKKKVSEDLEKGKSIAGIKILKSSVVINGGKDDDDKDDDDDGPDLGLILGICIPVGIIIIGLLVYFLCIRKSNGSQQPVDYNGGGDNSIRQTLELTKEEPAM